MHFRSTLHAVALFATVVSVGASNCQPGYWSSTGQSPCNACPSGTYQSQSSARGCTAAQAGWYARGPAATSQSECGPGYYSTGSAAECTICPAGSYCNGNGRTSPQWCQPGRYAPHPGSTQDCSLCPPGWFSAFSGATACCPCCSGWYNDQQSQTHCFNCPNRGSFQQGWSPVAATSAGQCIAASGALGTCTQTSVNSCPSTGGSAPSGVPGKRAPTSETQLEKRRNIPLPPKPRFCHRGHKSCPVYGVFFGRGFIKTYQCVDTDHELESCGGCVNDDSPNGEPNIVGGRDCSAISNVDTVRCQSGTCVIESCLPGYAISIDGTRCNPYFL